MTEEKQIGKITHFFSKIGVGVIELSDVLKVGETIKVVGLDHEFSQVVDSMQVEHENIEQAQAGSAVGLKLNEPSKEGDKVYRVIE
jgi:putative protease